MFYAQFYHYIRTVQVTPDASVRPTSIPQFNDAGAYPNSGNYAYNRGMRYRVISVSHRISQTCMQVRKICTSGRNARFYLTPRQHFSAFYALYDFRTYSQNQIIFIKDGLLAQPLLMHYDHSFVTFFARECKCKYISLF